MMMRLDDAPRHRADGLKARYIWIAGYEAFYYPRTGRVVVDVRGERLEFDSAEEAEDALDHMELCEG